ncbi:MAG: DUF1552 domain-containing protein [Bdellovibrionales bacterium]
MSKKLHRRSFLKGAGGIGIALPFLEIMGSEKAFAADPPKRFISTFMGQSLGAEYSYRNYTIPSAAGANYPLSVGLQPLGNRGVQGDVSVVSDLLIPTSGAGARQTAFHKTAHFAQYLGASFQSGKMSADQIAAQSLSAGTKLKYVHYLGQPISYNSDDSSFYNNATMSFTDASASKYIVGEISPNRAFRALFTGFTPPGAGPGVDPAVAAALAKRKSILDFILLQRDSLAKRLGASDSARLNDHLDQIRDLERSIASVEGSGASASCSVPGEPTDPNIGPYNVFNIDGEITQSSVGSNETLRNKIFCDLIHMAMVCDLTRVATHMYSFVQSFMAPAAAVSALKNANMTVHDIGHMVGFNGLPSVPDGTPFFQLSAANSRNDDRSYAMSLMHAWAVDHFAYLVDKFKKTPEGNGNMLDNTVMTMSFEGGIGSILDGGNNDGQWGSHSTQNMMMLIAGRAGGLKPGKHIVAPDVHPAKVTISALKAVGGPTTLGQISGDLPALFQAS